jgi:preprotein translocase subunit SecY
MLRAFINTFRIPDLRNKVLFTLFMLSVYRIGYYVPLPGVDQETLSSHFRGGASGSPVGQMADLFALFTGGDLGQSTLFGLGIMPYISASIILQLLVTVVPALEKLQKEGESGRRKNQRVHPLPHRRLVFDTVGVLGAVPPQQQPGVRRILDRHDVVDIRPDGHRRVDAGTMLLMWIGEQIDEYGIGNASA